MMIDWNPYQRFGLGEVDEDPSRCRSDFSYRMIELPPFYWVTDETLIEIIYPLSKVETCAILFLFEDLCITVVPFWSSCMSFVRIILKHELSWLVSLVTFYKKHLMDVMLFVHIFCIAFLCMSVVYNLHVTVILLVKFFLYCNFCFDVCEMFLRTCITPFLCTYVQWTVMIVVVGTCTV